jgi:uncharacterized protein (DUF924 family)
MPAALRPWAADLLHLWFHRLRPPQWFRRDDRLDALLRSRFAPLLTRLGKRPPHEFLRDPLTARAAILLFDQVPRNSFRGSPRAFAYDQLAVAIARGALRRGWGRPLSRSQRQFLLMPLMHSEVIADQHLSLRQFVANGDAGHRGFAGSHYRMIARFGRFPHRNAALGRHSSAAEQRALAAGNAW